MSKLPLYWIRSNNFGDALNPILYNFITGENPEWSEKPPKITAIGSIMSSANPRDTVWGTGCMFEDQHIACDNTTKFCAVRGPLTAKLLRDKGIDLPDDIPLGDPASLLPRFIPPSKIKTIGVAFLPHYSDYEKIYNLKKWVVPPIYPMANTVEIIDKITSMSYVVTSSLHGIVVAEAYGIPAVWVELSDNVAGNGFKFRDYYAITGRKVEPLNWKEKYDWREAAYIAADIEIPRQNADRLLESCPFKDEIFKFRDPSLSCQIPGINLFYDKYFPKKRGIFVEVGGNDGYTWSNTWHLAETGWRGIYYEPDLELSVRCINAHKRNNVTVIQKCVGSYNGEIKLYNGWGPTTNTYIAEKDLHDHGNSLSDYTMCPITTLNKSLEEEEDIRFDFDLLVIDVNGDEPLVLQGLDLDMWKPKMIIIATHKGHEKWDFNAQVVDRMLEHWYEEIWHDHINSIFIRRQI